MNIAGENPCETFKRGYIVTGVYPDKTIRFGLCDPEGGLLRDVAIVDWRYVIYSDVVDALVPMFRMPFYSWYLFGLFQDVFEQLVALNDTMISPDGFQKLLNECGFIKLEEEKNV